jgi:predicted CXXCH cytochrome family protein
MKFRRHTMILLLLLLTSCSAQRRHDLVQTLFDDPPQPDNGEAAVAELVDTSSRKKPAALLPVSRHAPFAAHDCNACHSLGASQSFPRSRETDPALGKKDRPAAADSVQRATRMKFGEGSLCYKCHTQMTVDELMKENTLIHGAVTQGFCGSCHHPHESPYPKLLTRGNPPADLCYFCHEKQMVREIERHDAWLEADCLDCHDAHASAGKYLLLPDYPENPKDRGD